MRTIFSIFTILTLVIFTGNTVLASPDEHGDEERKSIKHYEVAAPSTNEEAVKVIKDNLISSQEAVEKKDWHNVHVNSYNIEAATLALKELTGDESLKEKLQAFWVINEEVHIASESDEIKPEIVEEEFQKLQTSWDSLKLLVGNNLVRSNENNSETTPKKELREAIAELEKLLEQKTWAASKVQARKLVGIIRELDGYEENNPDIDVQRALILAAGNMTDNIKHKRYIWATTTLGKVRDALAIEPNTIPGE